MNSLETHPYKDFEGFLKWEDQNLHTKKVLQLSEKLWSTDKKKTLLCHDMKGGYLEDRFDDGYPSTECYHFYHWNLVDIFCYFSHNFVTVPPVQWINSAHNNGVKVIGTVITEWEDGKRNLQRVLRNRQSVDQFVENLVAVAKALSFEGWLINIECPVEPDQVELLVYMVKRLTERMHETNANAEVIWYDSVIKTGQLKWQNKLCEENSIFFDICDGIFLNYNWSDLHLKESIEMVKKGGGRRHHDIYVGVDVFGRGCPGGGGWNTRHAVEMIGKLDLSTAIFAFGWIYEKLGENAFAINNELFWDLLRDQLEVRPVRQLPLVTTFNRGYGDATFSKGEKISNTGLTNLSLVSTQPSFTKNDYVAVSGYPVVTTDYCYHTLDAYNGGGCLLYAGTFENGEQTNEVMFRLLKTDFLVNGDGGVLRLTMIYKHKFDQYHAQPELVLCGGDECREIFRLNAKNADVIKTNAFDWTKMEVLYKAERDARVEEIRFHLKSSQGRGRYQLLLGEIKIERCSNDEKVTTV